MSDEYIKKDDAITEVAEFLMGEALLDLADASDDIEDWKEIAVAILENIPPADVVERKRGEWLWHEDEDICNCSECEFEIDATGCIEPMEYVGVFHFCPNCGSDMRGDDNESD